MPDSVDRVKKSPGRPERTSGKPVAGASQPKSADAVQPTGDSSFHDVLTGISGGEAEKRLGKLLEEIGELAAQLATRRLLEDLESYRNKVGEFLRVYIDDVLDLRETSGRRGFSRRKQLLVVKKVNVELEELHRFVMDGAPDFQILKELGTIEGLLMDLYR